MPQFHCREHEIGPKNPHMRVWSDEMLPYRQFNIVRLEALEKLKQSFDQIGLGKITFHRCDGSDECKCKPMTYGETLASYL